MIANKTYRLFDNMKQSLLSLKFLYSADKNQFLFYTIGMFSDVIGKNSFEIWIHSKCGHTSIHPMDLHSLQLSKKRGNLYNFLIP